MDSHLCRIFGWRPWQNAETADGCKVRVVGDAAADGWDFSVKPSSAVVWICIWWYHPRRTLLRCWVCWAAPTVQGLEEALWIATPSSWGGVQSQSTYPNGIGSQRNSGSVSLTGFVFTSCWRLFGHVLKFWSFWQTTAFISEDFFNRVFLCFSQVVLKAPSHSDEEAGSKVGWKNVFHVFISPWKRSNALGLGTFGMSRFTEARGVYDCVWLVDVNGLEGHPQGWVLQAVKCLGSSETSHLHKAKRLWCGSGSGTCASFGRFQ